MKTTIAAILSSVCFAVAGTPVSFQQLPAGDSIVVTFTSSGCFHHYAYEFHFQHGRGFTVSVMQIEQRWNEAQKREETAKLILLGTTTLSEAEMAGLDRLFAYYRSMKRGGCTTVDQITATHKSGDTAKASESFTDATGKTPDMEGVTRFPSIIAKFKPKTK
jgi:hypothetical protein